MTTTVVAISDAVLRLLELTRLSSSVFFFQAEDGIRDWSVTGVQTCAFFFSSRRRHTRLVSDWSSDVCFRSTAVPVRGAVKEPIRERDADEEPARERHLSPAHPLRQPPERAPDLAGQGRKERDDRRREHRREDRKSVV